MTIARPQDLHPSWWSYKLIDGAFGGALAIDSPRSVAGPKLDRGRMAASSIFSTIAQDRQGDVLETGGIKTFNHRENPIAMLDHGKRWALPLGRTEDRDTGEYLVFIDKEAGEAWQTTHFSQRCPVAEQVYRMIDDGDLRGNSIGYRSLKAQPIGPPVPQGMRQPMHLIEVELLEVTWTALGMNPEAVRSILDRGIVAGKSLVPELRSALEPHAADRGVWSNGATLMPETTATAPAVTPEIKDAAGKNIGPMGTMGESNGGPMVKPPAMGGDGKSMEPHGPRHVRQLHKHLCDAKNFHETDKPMLEHGAWQKALEKMMPMLQKLLDGIEDKWREHHKDLDKLDGMADKPDSDDEGGDGDKSTDMGGMYAASLTGDQDGKSAAVETKEVPSPADELSAEEKDALPIILKMIQEIDGKLQAVEAEDQAQKKMLARAGVLVS